MLHTHTKTCGAMDTDAFFRNKSTQLATHADPAAKRMLLVAMELCVVGWL
jgi:hypothetical protein